MTRVEELIRDYHRTFNRIGNSERWRAILLLYCAALLCCSTYVLYNHTTGAAQTWCRIGYIAVLIAFLGYCVAMTVIILSRGALNRGSGERKLTALLQLLDAYQIDWRDKESVRKLIEESERANGHARLDLTILPRLAGLIAIPCLVCLIRAIRAAPVPDLMLDILGQFVVALEILVAVLAMAAVFFLLEWIAGRLAIQYREQASCYGVFSQQARQLLMFEPEYLEQLLRAARDAANGDRRRAGV